MSKLWKVNLSAPSQRPGHRFDNLASRDPALRGQSEIRNPAHPVKMARHHLIPWNQLRKFWDNMIRGGQFDLLSGTLIRQMSENIDRYPLSAKYRENVLGSFRVFDGLVSNHSLVHDPTALSDAQVHVTTFREMYCWMPGNLFIGPDGEHRGKGDPVEKFESDARAAAGAERFHKAFLAFESMNRFNQAIVGVQEASLLSDFGGKLLGVFAKDAATKLSAVAAIPTIEPVRAEAWTPVGTGTYQRGEPVPQYSLGNAAAPSATVGSDPGSSSADGSS